MKPKVIATIIGARPQFIKASAISAELAQSSAFDEVVIHTGQHFDTNMSDVFFSELGMRTPKYHCGINGGNHGEMTGRMLIEIEKILTAERPDVVLVYGDTNSTLAGALAAVKAHIPVAHVEAGLRSFNLKSPEEINRIVTDRVSRWLFTPTDSASAHLLHEGAEPKIISQVGDVMFDVALHYGARVANKGGVLGRLNVEHGFQNGNYCLATIHRAENTDDAARLGTIAEALRIFARDINIVLPLHPRTRRILGEMDQLAALERNVVITEPLSYLDMVQLEKHASMIITDSGGVQKEAFFYRVPCVTLRDETEWQELVESNWNRVVSPVSVDAVLDNLHASLGTKGKEIFPYGQGDAAKKIVQRLTHDLN
jgi:UDP-GlcNAc3NAcA epimerase